MTAQKSACKFFDIKYFLNVLRRSWSFGFISFIITFACMPIAILMEANAAVERFMRNPDYIDVERAMIDFHEDSLVYLWIFIFSAFAIISGILYFDYMLNRKKAYLYHSLPHTRGTHFVCNISAAFTWFLLSVAVNSLISILILAATDVISGAVVAVFFSSLLRACLYFPLFLSLFALSASLTGQIISTLTGLAVFSFLPICIYMAYQMIVHYDTTFSRFNEVNEFFIYTSPVVRVFFDADYDFTAVEAVVTLLCSVALFVLAFLIYRKRKIESAGTPVVINWVGELFKYLIMFPVSFFAGVLFEAFGGTMAWLYFGFVFGAFLSLIFINLFLYRSPSKMFFAKKGFAIFLSCFLVFFTLIGCNVFHHDRFIPDENLVTSVELKLDGEKYKIRSDDKIEFVLDYADDMIKEYLAREDTSVYYNSWMYLNIHTIYGVNMEKKIPVCDEERARELYSMLYSSDEYLCAVMKNIEKREQDASGTVWVNVWVLGDFSYSVHVDAPEFLSAYLLDMQNPERYYSRYICTVYEGSLDMRIYSSDVNTLNLIAREIGFSSADEMLSAFEEFACESIVDARVFLRYRQNDAYFDLSEVAAKYGVSLDDKEIVDLYPATDSYPAEEVMLEYTGERARQIYRALCGVRRYDYTFVNCDENFEVSISYKISDEAVKAFHHRYGIDGRGASYPSYGEDERVWYVEGTFFDGFVPEFVLNDFSSEFGN